LGVAVAPVPDKLIVCGLPEALSVMPTDAVRVPLAVGVKVTLIAQLLPAATLPLVGHVVAEVKAKSPGFVPLSAMPVILRAALPVLESVTACAVLAVPTPWAVKVRLAGERLTAGAVWTGGVLLPPPQAAQIPTTSNAVANTSHAGRRRAALRLISIARANRPTHSQGNPTCRRKLGGTLCPGARGGILAVVVIESVEVTEEELLTVTGEGEALQVASAGAPVQVSVTLPVNPFVGAMVSVEVVEPPAVTLTVVGLAEKLKSAAPVTVMVIGGVEVEPV
jgi:hypothetical protein